MAIRLFEIKYFLTTSFFCGLALLLSSCGTYKNPVVRDQPQCAHWSILRCCQLCGVSVTMPFILEKLPPHPSGHSLLQIVEVLRDLGLEVEGRMESESTFAALSFPLIAHLNNPGHFVVIAAADDKIVHIYDGSGQRMAQDIHSFFECWSGEVLRVQKLSAMKRLSDSASPEIQFDTLLLDVGTVPATGAPIPFEFAFKNVGNQDLVIEGVHPDCSCIKTELPENAISPNKTGIIRLYYHVQPRDGLFSHQVIVKSNDTMQPIALLMVSGWTGSELIIEPLNIYLPDLVVGHEKTVHCLIKYTGGDIGLNVSLGETSISNAVLTSHKLEPLSEEMRRQFLPHTHSKNKSDRHFYLLELTLKPTGHIDEHVKGIIAIHSNIKGYELFMLHLNGKINGMMKAYPSIIDFRSDFSENDTIERTVTLVNHTEELLKIVSIEQSPHNMMIDYPKNHFDKSMDITFVLPKDDVLPTCTSFITMMVKSCSTDEVFNLPIMILGCTTSVHERNAKD